MTERSSRAARLARRLGLGLASGVLLLLVAEVLVRTLAAPVRVNDVQLADAELGFRNPQVCLGCWDAGGTFDFVTNSLGCRGPELPPSGTAPAAARRVLLLGDSFLQAWNVREEDWVGTSLRAELARAETRAEVYSLSASDFGTAQELLALRQYGERVRPDEVVLLVYPCNDLINNTLELAGRSRVSANDTFRPYLIPDGSGGFERRYALPWHARLRHSHLFRLLEQRWLAGQDADRLREELAGERLFDPQERLARGELPEEYLEIFRAPGAGGRWVTAWQRTEALVLGVRSEAARLGARFTAVVIPGREQVEHTIQSEALDAQLRAAGLGGFELALDLDLPERRLEEFFRREGIAHVQMLAPLREQAAATRTDMYMRDAHLNGVAHALMGRVLARRLVEQEVDTCFEAGRPVDMLALLGEPPLRLDFSQNELWRLFAWGWSEWTSPFVKPELPGWGLDASGAFLARAGFVTLEGMLSKRASFPLTLALAPLANPHRPIARGAFASAGPFALRFELPRDTAAPSPWTLLCLRIDGARKRTNAGPRLMLQRMRIDPSPPDDWQVQPMAESQPKNRKQWFVLCVLRESLSFPATLLQFLSWRTSTVKH